MPEERQHGIDGAKQPSGHQNAPMCPYMDTTVTDLIERQMLMTPDLVAVHAWDGFFTYQELGNTSTSLARHLHKKDVGRGSTVAICLDKSKWVPVAMLAIVKAGAAFVAFDPSHPAARLRDIVDQVDAELIVTQKEYEDYFAQTGRELLLDVEATIWRQRGHTDCCEHYHQRPTPGDVLFYAFTSGSTGRPKGVMHLHGPACNSMAEQLPGLGYTCGARVLQFSSYAYIPGVWYGKHSPSVVISCC